VKLGQERHKVFQAAAQAIDVPGHSLRRIGVWWRPGTACRTP
jgi:hypothetical protein